MKKNKLWIITIFSITFLTAYMLAFGSIAPVYATYNTNEFNDVTIYSVVNETEIYVNKPFELLTIIVNPTTSVMENISFYILAPTNIEILSFTNTSEIQTFITTTFQNVNISIKITKIDMNTTAVHKLVIVSNKSGELTFDYSDAHFYKVKGEYVDEAYLTIPDRTINVKSEVKAPPEEGKIERPEIIYLGLLILPLISYFISPKLMKIKN